CSLISYRHLPHRPSFPTRRSSDLDAFLELAAVLGSGDHQRHVEGDDTLVAEDLRDIAPRDLLRESLDDRGLPDPGLAQQNGIVLDRKSTRLNSSHVKISYAVFCLK